MELLDSIIAFALIMAALATVVTLIMEIFHRVLKLRAKGMEQLFAQFYDDVVSQYVPDPVGQAQQAGSVAQNSQQALLAKQKQNISDAVLQNPVKPKLCHNGVSTDDLLKRLDQAGAFTDLRKKTDKEFRKTLETIESRYDEYSAAATDFFKRRAQLLSLLVGIILAFSVNIDAMRILDSLMTSSQLRASIINQQKNLYTSFHSAQAGLAKLQKSETAATAQADMQQIETLETEVAGVSQKLDQLGSLGVSIGWTYYPGNVGKKPESAGSCWLNLLAWFFKVFITGLLIGLGAPFWFDVAQRLSQIKQGFKGKGTSNLPLASPTATGQVQPVKTTVDKIVNG